VPALVGDVIIPYFMFPWPDKSFLAKGSKNRPYTGIVRRNVKLQTRAILVGGNGKLPNQVKVDHAVFNNLGMF